MDKLARLNFSELIHIDNAEIESYTFDCYKKNGYKHEGITGYCISCEKNNCNVSPKNTSFKMSNISHGAHASDFLRSMGIDDTNGWVKAPVMFIYESPSLDYGIFKNLSYSGYDKRPTQKWYWIHSDKNASSYPTSFKGGQYGDFIASAINTFKLKNAYVTNLVKCGLNNDKGKYKGLDFYDTFAIENCYENFLQKEIEIIEPKVIFALSSGAEKQIKKFTKDIYVHQLPHPAGRQRGFRNDHYRAVYFWGIIRALQKVGVLTLSDAIEYAKPIWKNTMNEDNSSL